MCVCVFVLVYMCVCVCVCVSDLGEVAGRERLDDPRDLLRLSGQPAPRPQMETCAWVPHLQENAPLRTIQ